MDNFLHTNLVTMRVTGRGDLDLRLIGLYEDIDEDDPPVQELKPIQMQSATPRITQTLANFMEQYTQLEFSVDKLDEYFKINKIVLYVKPTWKSYPQ